MESLQESYYMDAEVDVADDITMEGFDEDTLMPESSGIIPINIELNSENLRSDFNINEPVRVLRDKVQGKLNFDLSDYKVSLEHLVMLDDERPLVEQAGVCNGLISMNVAIVTDMKYIMLTKVLQSPMNSPKYESNMDTSRSRTDTSISDYLSPPPSISDSGESAYPHSTSRSGSDEPDSPKKAKRNSKRASLDLKEVWKKLKVPSDPKTWNKDHVHQWVTWAVQYFDLTDLKLSDWSMTGQELLNLSEENFKKLVPSDPKDCLWKHLGRLRNKGK